MPRKWRTLLPVLKFALVLWSLAPGAIWSAGAFSADSDLVVEKRLADCVADLTSEALGGRREGTPGAACAAEHIAAQLARCGLKTDWFDGTPLQRFPCATKLTVRLPGHLAFAAPGSDPTSPQRLELTPETDFIPLTSGNFGPTDLPLVFAGYGMTDPRYDDYAGIDVAGKAVIILCHTPQYDNPKGLFYDKAAAECSTWAGKVANARSHKAAAVLLVQDSGFIRKKIASTRGLLQLELDELTQEIARQKEKEKEDPSPEARESPRRRIANRLRTALMWDEKLRAASDPPLSSEPGSDRAQDFGHDLPVFFCRRAVVDSWLRAATELDLTTLEREIDEAGAPRSRPLTSGRLAGTLVVEPVPVEARNVLATYEGAGTLAEETVILGAHYDGVGNQEGGWPGSEQRLLFPAANDNASGVAVMLEVARAVAQVDQTPRRRVVFIAFGGEECGTLGSRHYVHHPLFPLEKTAAMINLDVVGQLGGDRLGARQNKPALFDALAEQLAPRHGLHAQPTVQVGGACDSASFSGEGIPALWLVAGDSAMHTPNDRPETLNYPGMRRIAAFVTEMITSLATSSGRLGATPSDDKPQAPNQGIVHESPERVSVVPEMAGGAAAPLTAGAQTPLADQKREPDAPATPAAETDKPGEGNYLVVPLRTELQRLGRRGAGVDLFVLINSDAVAEDPNILNAGALATTRIAKAMQECKEHKKVSFCLASAWTAKKNKEVMDSIARQQQGLERPTMRSTAYLQSALTELAHRMEFPDVQWDNLSWEEGAKDWKSLVADMTAPEEANQEESAVGDETVKIFPVRTALSRLVYSDADYVIWIVPWVENLKASDVVPIQQKIQRYVHEAHLENRHKCMTIFWLGQHADQESEAAFNKITEPEKLKELTGVGSCMCGGGYAPEGVK